MGQRVFRIFYADQFFAVFYSGPTLALAYPKGKVGFLMLWSNSLFLVTVLSEKIEVSISKHKSTFLSQNLGGGGSIVFLRHPLFFHEVEITGVA